MKTIVSKTCGIKFYMQDLIRSRFLLIIKIWLQKVKTSGDKNFQSSENQAISYVF